MCDCSGWTVSRSGDRVLVAGRCTCPLAGYRLELRPAPDQPDPARLMLDLHVEPPEFGATVMTTVDVAWAGEAGRAVREVEVRVAGGRDGAVVPVPS